MWQKSYFQAFIKYISRCQDVTIHIVNFGLSSFESVFVSSLLRWNWLTDVFYPFNFIQFYIVAICYKCIVNAH